MAFSIQSIMGRTGTSKVLDTGKNLFYDHVVSIDKTQSFWKGEIEVRGTVLNRFKPVLLLKEDRINRFTCNCGETAEGLCSHCVALAYAYQNKSLIKEQPMIYTSFAARDMINGYLKRAISEINEFQEEQLMLEPVLSVSDHILKSRFKLVHGKTKYLIRDLNQFCSRMEDDETVSYGKNLSVRHNLRSFVPKSRDLIMFLMQYRKERMLYSTPAITKQSYAEKEIREIQLAGYNADRFVDILIKSGFGGDRYDAEGEAFQIIQGNPNVEIIISGIGNQGAEVSIRNEIETFFGEQHMYICSDRRIYRCDEKYTEAMGLFLKSLSSGSERGKNKVTIHKKDLPGFYTGVYPILSESAMLSMDGIDLEEYAPEELKATFLFDVNEDGAVTCQVTCVYENVSFQLMGDEPNRLSVSRNFREEYRIRNLLLKYFIVQDDSTLLITKDDESIYQLLESGLSEFRDSGDVYVTDEFQGVKISRQPKIAVGVSMKSDLLSMNVTIDGISGEELNEVLKAYRLKKKYHRLNSGSIIRLDEYGLSVISELADGLILDTDGIGKRTFILPKYRAFYVENVLRGSNIEFNRDADYKTLIRAIKSVEDSDFSIPGTFCGTLRGYQVTGFQWLKTMEACGFGGILADDMGLGKTIQIISLLLSQKEKKEQIGPSLIICPASLIYNWENELMTFAPSLKCAAIVGAASERKQIIVEYGNYDVLITSYDLLKRDIELYSECKFHFHIIDEAQYIKNHTTQSARAVKKIHSETRFALTGTPIENKLSELWSIFDFLMPRYLFSYRKYKEFFETPIVKSQDTLVLKRLNRMIAPFIMRRLKQEVLSDLPEKLETIVYSRLDGEQQKLYAANAGKLKENLMRQTGNDYRENQIQILAELTKLRQICCDPSLCYENYEDGSAKLETCLDLVRNGIEGGHKILLFSQFTSMLDIIAMKLKEEAISYYNLTGATKKEERMNLVGKFNRDDTSVFLISLRAGGTGLNLTGADMVIHYDPWWNAAVQNQATDRAHRIGQKNQVSVFKLIAKSTIEESIAKLQMDKQNLADSVITEGNLSLSRLTKEELIELLIS